MVCRPKEKLLGNEKQDTVSTALNWFTRVFQTKEVVSSRGLCVSDDAIIQVSPSAQLLTRGCQVQHQSAKQQTGFMLLKSNKFLKILLQGLIHYSIFP